MLGSTSQATKNRTLHYLLFQNLPIQSMWPAEKIGKDKPDQK